MADDAQGNLECFQRPSPLNMTPEISPPPVFRRVTIEEAYHLGKAEEYVEKHPTTASLLWRRMPLAAFDRRTI